ncbi:unnamed protein product [Mucor hiemalis]
MAQPPPLDSILNSLVDISGNIASIQFEKGNSQLVQDLIQRQKLVRDTDANENKLAAICLGGSLLNKILDISKSVETDDIDRILRSANSLNQICKDPAIEKKCHELAILKEERKINLEYLRTTQEKNDQELDSVTARNTEQNSHLENTDSYIEEVEEEVDKESLEIQKLEEELAIKQGKNNILYQTRESQLKIGKDIKELNLFGTSLIKSNSYKRALDNIKTLEKEKDVQKRRLNDYDAVLRSLAEDRKETASTLQKPATTREIYTGFRARIEKLLKSQPTHDKDYNIKELKSMFESIERELKEILERIKEVELTKKHMNINKSTYVRLLTYIENKQPHNNGVDFDGFNKIFPHNQHTTVPKLELSKDAIIMTPILLKLYEEGQVKLSTLTSFVEDLAKKHEFTERQSIQCIYKLVAADLLIIDRTHKDSLVKLKLDVS